MAENKLHLQHDCPYCDLGYGRIEHKQVHLHIAEQMLTIHIGFDCPACFNSWLQTVVLRTGEILSTEVELLT